MPKKGDNVQVVIRCRPQNKRETRKHESTIVETNTDSAEIVVQHASRNNRDDGRRKFTFDQVFGPESSQVEVYETVVKPVVAEVLQGFNCTVFACTFLVFLFFLLCFHCLYSTSCSSLCFLAFFLTTNLSLLLCCTFPLFEL